MALAAAVALLRYKVGVIPVIAASALAGFVLKLAGWAWDSGHHHSLAIFLIASHAISTGPTAWFNRI